MRVVEKGSKREKRVRFHRYYERRLVVYWVGPRCSEPSSIPGDFSKRFSCFISRNGVRNRKIQFVTEKF